MRYIISTEGKEVWWSWQRLGANDSAMQGRAWLHGPKNHIGVEWALSSRFRPGGYIKFADMAVGDDQFTIAAMVPFVGNFYFSIGRVRWVTLLPGVEWDGDWGSGEREIDIRWFDNALWWNLWTFPGESRSRWNEGCFSPLDFLLGREKYTKAEGEPQRVVVPMPEGDYPATATLCMATHKRPRWYKARSYNFFNIEMDTPIPVPGKGENSWDMGDDALFKSSLGADTMGEAVAAVKAGALRDRERHAGEGWVPAEGWPVEGRAK